MVPRLAESKQTETRIGADDARQQLGDVIDRAWDGERIIITRHERERVVVLGWRDYERLKALEVAAV